MTHRTPMQQRVDLVSQRALAAAMMAESATKRLELERFRAAAAELDMRQRLWKRPCFVCSALWMCSHREVERWETGARA